MQLNEKEKLELYHRAQKPIQKVVDRISYTAPWGYNDEDALSACNECLCTLFDKYDPERGAWEGLVYHACWNKIIAEIKVINNFNKHIPPDHFITLSPTELDDDYKESVLDRRQEITLERVLEQEQVDWLMGKIEDGDVVTAIMLQATYGYTIAEVATMLGIDCSGLYKRVRKAQKIMREKYKTEYQGYFLEKAPLKRKK